MRITEKNGLFLIFRFSLLVFIVSSLASLSVIDTTVPESRLICCDTDNCVAS